VKKLGSVALVVDNFVQGKRRKNEKDWDGLPAFSATETTEDL